MKLLLPLLIWYVLPHWIAPTAFLLSFGIYMLSQGVILSLKSALARLDRKYSSLVDSNVIHVDFRGGRGAREALQR